MKNITFTLDEHLISAGREYAKKNKTSLNALVEELLIRLVIKNPKDAIEEAFSLADKQNIKSENGTDWKREDLYDR